MSSTDCGLVTDMGNIRINLSVYEILMTSKLFFGGYFSLPAQSIFFFFKPQIHSASELKHEDNWIKIVKSSSPIGSARGKSIFRKLLYFL